MGGYLPLVEQNITYDLFENRNILHAIWFANKLTKAEAIQIQFYKNCIFSFDLDGFNFAKY